MSGNSYNDFKEGIKKDVGKVVLDIYFIIPLFLLIIIVPTVLIAVFNENNHYKDSTQILAAIISFALVVLLFYKRTSNAIITAITILFYGSICLGLLTGLGYFLYLIWSSLFVHHTY